MLSFTCISKCMQLTRLSEKKNLRQEDQSFTIAAIRVMISRWFTQNRKIPGQTLTKVKGKEWGSFCFTFLVFIGSHESTFS